MATQSSTSKKCNYSGTSAANRPRSPLSDGSAAGPTGAGALQGLDRSNGPRTQPADSADLERELNVLYNNSDRLQAQMPPAKIPSGLPN